jgi:hypothetical protein
MRSNRGDNHCDSFTHYALQRAMQRDIDTVYIGFSTWFTDADDRYFCASENDRRMKTLSPDEETQWFVSGLAKEIAAFHNSGKR